ncbi:MAG: hypothetical protein AAB358_00625 [Patescibacteria group bacterium]
MKIPIPQNINPAQAIRRCGYGLVGDRRAREQSFSRRMGSGFYPRFHIYIEGGFFNLHLDQKQASYEGANKHSGEYDGETVEREAERIRRTLENSQGNNNTSEIKEKKSGGWFSNLFR